MNNNSHDEEHENENEGSIDKEVALTLHEISLLQPGNPEHLVDVKISQTGLQDAEMIRNGYEQITSDDKSIIGTFGKGRSLWIRRRKQGTCSGRLKPIVDIQLMNISTSSAMVLSGYTCLVDPIGSQWIWIKRADSDEEERDAILNFHITFGKAKIPSDKIWSSPGVGWIRVDGNFSMGSVIDFNKQDIFLWFLPNRTRSPETIAMSPVRSTVVMNDDVRRERIIFQVRNAVRLHVPTQEIKRLTQSEVPFSQTGEVDDKSQNRNDRFSGPIALYNKVAFDLIIINK
jgi:hypothetical protein